MFTGFKEFIMRGNVIDLAVAVVIGTAFTVIITVLVEGVINPAIGALFNTENLNNAFILEIPTLTGGTAQILFGALIAAAIQFLLVAIAVYFALVLPVNRMKENAEAKRKAGAPEDEVPPTELALLAEIRDLLVKAENASSGGSGQAK